MNTTIMPNEGIYSCKKISVELAKDLVNFRDKSNLTSAIGHQGTADAFNALGFWNGEVTVNRIQATFKHGDVAICLKVVGRLAEGQILTRDELERVGYEFYLVQYFSADSAFITE